MGWLRSILRLRAGPRVLFIDDFVPDPRIGAGAPRALALQRAIVATGAKLTLLPIAGDPEDVAAACTQLPARELALGCGAGGLAGFLAQRGNDFDVIMVSRPHNMAIFRRSLSENPGLRLRAAVVYDAEALFAERYALQLYLLGRPLPAEEARKRIDDELALAAGSRIVITVSDDIARVFRKAGVADVRTIGHAVKSRPTATGFLARDELLFVGPTGDDTPNTDSVVWFADEILPRIRHGLGRDLSLQVVGNARSALVAGRKDGRLKLHGPIADITPLYERARVFVAPTRFASGIPLKVHEAAAHGVPVVLTPLLARQLGWMHEQDVLVAESAEDFAAACLRLYGDQALWERIRAAALRRVAADCDPRHFKRTVAQLVSDVVRFA